MALPDDRSALLNDDPLERLSPDDQVTQREHQFLMMALQRQARVGLATAATPGTCSNCGEACLPQAVYCDQDCRADHQYRLQVLGRQGRAL